MIAIEGAGIAAVCAARLLSSAGLAISTQATAAPRPASILIGETTQTLLADISQHPNLFAGFHPIRRRIVAWGPQATQPHELPHSALAVPEAVLLHRLATAPAHLGQPPAWRILAQRTTSTEHHFGTRIASVQAVELRPTAFPDACWVESVPSGWLFLLALGEGRATLISVGAGLDSLLSESRLAAAQIERTTGAPAPFPAYPRICPALCGPGWLACGSAAMSFDPICGEGAGHAVREAILASASFSPRLPANPKKSSPVTIPRVSSAPFAPLETCLTFYQRPFRSVVGPGDSLLDRGLAWCRTDSAAPPYRYRLSGFSLEALAGDGDQR